VVQTNVLPENASVAEKMKALPKAEADRLRPFWGKLSSLEFQWTRVALAGLCSPLIPLTVLVLLFELTPNPIPRSFLSNILGLRNPTTSCLEGVGIAIVSMLLGAFLFWCLHLRPERRRLRNELIRMLAADSTLVRDTLAIDPELIRKSRKVLTPYA
jgi:hypothetical protein